MSSRHSSEDPLILPLSPLLSKQTFDLFKLSTEVCDSIIVAVIIIAPATSCRGALAPAADDEYITFHATPVSGKPNSCVRYNYTSVGDNDHANLQIKPHHVHPDLLTMLDLYYRCTRSSTAEIMTTAPLPPARAFFILSRTSLTLSELTTIATTFLVVYARSVVPTPLPDETLSFSFPEPFTSYIVDSRPNALRVDVIESTFSDFRTTASLFREVVFDLLPAVCEYVTSKGKVELSLTI